MKLDASYLVRGVRVSRSFSYPRPSLEDVYRLDDYITWLERQEGARVTIA